MPSSRPVVAVSGEVDVYSAPALRDGLTELLESGTSVVVDLTEVGFLDSTGLGALVAARNDAEDQDAELVLRAPSDRVRRILDVTGLLDVFAIIAGLLFAHPPTTTAQPTSEPSLAL